jgi:hypothetical protein
MRWSSRRTPLPDELTLRPATARAWERAEDGHVVVLVPKFDGKVLGRWLMPRLREPHMKIHLDALGSAVWEACDGTRTGGDIAALLAERFPEATQLPDRVRRFLLQLRVQGHVA